MKWDFKILASVASALFLLFYGVFGNASTNSAGESECAVRMSFVAQKLEDEGYLFRGTNTFQALEQLSIYGQNDANVIIKGETGSGKEMIAHTLHKLGTRRNGPFIAVDATNLSIDTATSELFGHERGSFTGAFDKSLGFVGAANGGTLFIDEIARMPLPAQFKLLRFLSKRAKDREYQGVGMKTPVKSSVRVIVATNQNLFEMTKQGTFNEDLYHRLNVGRIELPPLRERKDEIIDLAELFLRNFSKEYGRDFRSLPQEAKTQIMNYPWPGNVRELSNLIERSVLESPRDGFRLVFDSGQKDPKNAGSPFVIRLDPTKGNVMEMAEYEALRLALEQAGGNKTLAAKILGVSLKTVHNKVNQGMLVFPALRKFHRLGEALSEDSDAAQ
jgi:DNA-binding NtrC family response regulator